MFTVITMEFALLVSALSVLSGIGSYLQGVRENRLKGRFLDFFTEVTLALVVGLATAYTGHSMKLNEAMTCALVLIFSNNGADTVALLKKIFKQLLAHRFGLNTNSNNNGA